MKTIGILGGMGPEATNKLATLITSLTPVSKDQDHVPVISFNNSQIPHRINAIFHNTKSPVPEMIRMAKGLEMLGADFLIIPCNTAHYFIPEIQTHINIPFINMMDETVKFIVNNYPDTKKVGILGTNLTIKMGLYENPLMEKGIEVVIPSEDEEEKVMEAIYGIKGGLKDKGKAILIDAAKNLIESGAEVIIAGCTEIPLVLHQENLNFILLDPSKIVAESAINLASREEFIEEQRIHEIEILEEEE
ncbi:amino acid racemase [Candidatus Woesearchaeota archaeon]|jgi:aspartate racemase|nr:amino acid racemase [Candidatus Woesearchaeota archaeon]MBT4150365.1 amino acid racemase [Candidatus Woesearchaeota archaeon]MBT4246991.1 amino acid racemase [Candidatus Woesearchaeota archaeon]MBT4434510.1 amino acid racemase [Candidatus Woesearchaeota archaeon]MBT7331972.1 amino acid racemase [Candidatus Woesearchaeota archaeon]